MATSNGSKGKDEAFSEKNEMTHHRGLLQSERHVGRTNRNEASDKGRGSVFGTRVPDTERKLEMHVIILIYNKLN